MKKYLLSAFYVIVIVFVAAEGFLRLTGRFATYSESIGGKYTSYYGAVVPRWHMVRSSDQVLRSDNRDFQYSIAVNHLGIREKNFEKTKSDSCIRIFVTGDSFAEGMGASVDSSWPHLLNKYLTNDGVKTEVINTGVAGSDPVYNYTMHRDILKGYKADYLIVSLNSSDFTDYMMRGGFERFHADGTTHYCKGPWYEPLYHYSFFARGIIERIGGFPFRGVFANENDFYSSADKAIECYSAVVDSFINLVKADNTHVIVLMYSTPSEIRFNNNEEKKFHQSFIALQQKLAEKNIDCINIWDDMKTRLVSKNYLDYTYPNDSHYNPYGYNLMAQIIEKQLLERKLIAH